MNVLPKRLQTARSKLKLTQTDVAKKICSTQANVSAYETGIRTPPIDVIADFAKLYKVSTDYLIGVSDELDPENIEAADNKKLAILSKLPQDDAAHPLSLDILIDLVNSLATYIAVGSPAGSAPVNTAGDVIFAIKNLLDAAASEEIGEIIDKANALAAAGLSATETINGYMERQKHEKGSET